MYSAYVPTVTDIDGDKGRVLLYLSNAGGPVRIRRAAKDLGITRQRLLNAAFATPSRLVMILNNEIWWAGGER